MFVTIDFTYADAPIKLRKEHEENCRANEIVPKDSGSIEIIPRFYKDFMDLKNKLDLILMLILLIFIFK